MLIQENRQRPTHTNMWATSGNKSFWAGRSSCPSPTRKPCSYLPLHYIRFNLFHCMASIHVTFYLNQAIIMKSFDPFHAAAIIITKNLICPHFSLLMQFSSRVHQSITFVPTVKYRLFGYIYATTIKSILYIYASQYMFSVYSVHCLVSQSGQMNLDLSCMRPLANLCLVAA